MASTTLDLPQPLGPTTAVIPGLKVIAVVSEKDLKPSRSRLLSRILHPLHRSSTNSQASRLLLEGSQSIDYAAKPSGNNRHALPAHFETPQLPGVLSVGLSLARRTHRNPFVGRHSRHSAADDRLKR